jgi:hypothetical protein
MLCTVFRSLGYQSCVSIHRTSRAHCGPQEFFFRNFLSENTSVARPREVWKFSNTSYELVQPVPGSALSTRRALCTAPPDGAEIAKRALETYLRLRSQGRQVSEEHEKLLARALDRFADELEAKVGASFARPSSHGTAQIFHAYFPKHWL